MAPVHVGCVMRFDMTHYHQLSLQHSYRICMNSVSEARYPPRVSVVTQRHVPTVSLKKLTDLDYFVNCDWSFTLLEKWIPETLLSTYAWDTIHWNERKGPLTRVPVSGPHHLTREEQCKLPAYNISQSAICRLSPAQSPCLKTNFITITDANTTSWIHTQCPYPVTEVGITFGFVPSCIFDYEFPRLCLYAVKLLGLIVSREGWGPLIVLVMRAVHRYDCCLSNSMRAQAVLWAREHKRWIDG